MFEVDGHLKLLLASILDIYKAIEHIDMLSIGIWYQPYTVNPTLLCLGVVHAYVVQKLVKSNKITSFNQCPKHRI